MMIMFIDRSMFVTKVNSDKPIANNIMLMTADRGTDLAETTKFSSPSLIKEKTYLSKKYIKLYL